MLVFEVRFENESLNMSETRTVMIEDDDATEEQIQDRMMAECDEITYDFCESAEDEEYMSFTKYTILKRERWYE